ncbi:MAG: hypothetical protein KatS3mg110_0029 [Pirellulaceae bacterium]|nr:MAG: hypothetical protein KatS3mg110_0029 [Pirellulaceae bacterium]
MLGLYFLFARATLVGACGILTALCLTVMISCCSPRNLLPPPTKAAVRAIAELESIGCRCEWWYDILLGKPVVSVSQRFFSADDVNNAFSIMARHNVDFVISLEQGTMPKSATIPGSVKRCEWLDVTVPVGATFVFEDIVDFELTRSSIGAGIIFDFSACKRLSGLKIYDNRGDRQFQTILDKMVDLRNLYMENYCAEALDHIPASTRLIRLLVSHYRGDTSRINRLLACNDGRMLFVALCDSNIDHQTIELLASLPYLGMLWLKDLDLPSTAYEPLRHCKASYIEFDNVLVSEELVTRLRAKGCAVGFK